MVNFLEHLKNSPKKKDPNVITGTLTAWVKSQRTGDVVQRKCTWEIGPYASSHGEWIAFSIVKGGVTGYESFIIREEESKGEGLRSYSLDPLFRTNRGGYWPACAGGMGWDEMRIQNRDLRAAIQQWLDREGLTYPEEE